MSAAFVPGRILLVAYWSYFAAFSASVAVDGTLGPIPGDFGPIWTSGNGGGLGRRCEGDAGAAISGTNPSSIGRCC